MKLIKSGNVTCLSRRVASFIKLTKSDIKLCETWSEEGQSYDFYMNEYKNNAKNLVQYCNSSCTQLQYVGQNTFSKGRGKTATSIQISYDFLTNDVQIIEEYFMFGMNDLIGTIGGHSGLFIGFSFYGFISTFFGYIQRQFQPIT